MPAALYDDHCVKSTVCDGRAGGDLTRGGGRGPGGLGAGGRLGGAGGRGTERQQVPSSPVQMPRSSRYLWMDIWGGFDRQYDGKYNAEPAVAGQRDSSYPRARNTRMGGHTG